MHMHRNCCNRMHSELSPSVNGVCWNPSMQHQHGAGINGKVCEHVAVVSRVGEQNFGLPPTTAEVRSDHLLTPHTSISRRETPVNKQAQLD